jgi:hypothetical protein
VHGKAGTVVFWHRACLHSVGANYSDTIRQAIIYDFPSASAAPLLLDDDNETANLPDDDDGLEQGGDGAAGPGWMEMWSDVRDTRCHAARAIVSMFFETKTTFNALTKHRKTNSNIVNLLRGAGVQGCGSGRCNAERRGIVQVAAVARSFRRVQCRVHEEQRQGLRHGGGLGDRGTKTMRTEHCTLVHLLNENNTQVVLPARSRERDQEDRSCQIVYFW